MTKIGRTVASYAPFVGVAVVTLGMLGQPAAAQDVREWLGADNDVWNNSGNWNPQDVPDTTAEDAVSNGTNGTIIDVDGTFTVNRVLLNSGGAHTLDNGTLLFNNFTDVQGSTVNSDLATAGGFSTVQIEGSATTTLTGALFTDDAGGATFSLAPITAGDALDVSGVLRDGTTTLGLLAEGDGTVNLNGTNTFTGTTTIGMGATGVTNLTGALTQTSGVTVTSGRLNTGGGIHDAAAVAVNGGTFGLTGDETIGALSGAGSIDLGASTLTFGDATDAEYSGVASGTGGLTKAGTGTQTLSGVNTFTGSLNVDAGTLAVSGTGSVLDAASVAVAAGGVLAVDGAGGNALADDAVVDLGSGATLRLFNSGEKIARTSGASDASIDLNGQTLTVGSAVGGGIVAVITGEGTLRKEGVGETQLQNTHTMIGSVVVAEGTLNLRGSLNSASGFTVDNGAILELSSAGGSKIGDAVDIANAGTLFLNGVDETVGTVSGAGDITLTGGTLTLAGDGDTATISGVVSGNGALAKTGDDALTLSGANTFTGGITLDFGTLVLANDDAAGTGTVTLERATLGFGDGVTVGNTIAVEGSGGAASLDVSAGSAEHSGVISGSGTRFVSKTGAGTLTLSGTSTYTGLFNVVEGTLDVIGSLASEQIGFEGPSAVLILNGNSLSDTAVTLTFDQGSMIVRGDEQIGALISGANGAVTLESGVTLTTGLDGRDDTFAGTISGDGALTKQGDGIFTLSGANTFTGGITLAEGTLRLASDTAAGTGTITTTGSVIDYADGVTIANGIVLNSDTTQLQVSGTDSAEQSGVISETGGARPLEKIGTGTLILSGANTYTGGTTVTGGTLDVTGSIASAIVTVEDGASLRVDGAALLDTADVTLNGTGDLTLTGSETIGSIASASGTSTVTLGANTLTMSDADTTFAGGFTGTGDVIKQGNGTFRLSGTSITSGTLFNEAGTTDVSGTWNSDIQNTATLEVTGTVDGNVTNGAGVVTVADGTVTGNVTGAGAGTVSLVGAGRVDGSISNSAAVNLSGTSSVGADVAGFTTLNLDSSNAAGVGGAVSGTTLNVATQDTAATASVGGDVSVSTLNFGGGATGFLDTTGSLTVTGAATVESAILGFDIGAVGGQVQTSGLTVASFTAPTNPTTLKFEVNDALTGRGIDVSGEYVVINITDPANALNPANFALDAANIAKSGEDSLGGALLVASLTNGSGALGTLGGAEDLVLRFQIDPAITAIGGQIATVQNLLGGVINRPSSPLIAALAFDAEDNESNGLWFRAQGGSAEVTSSTTNGTSNLPSTVDATYGGFQFGFDSGRFNAFDGGEDLVAGGFAGALQGSTEAQNFNIDPNNPQQLGSLRGDVTTSDFEQVFVGGYLAYASGLFSGDVQLRFEHTDFTFDNPVIDLRDAKTSAQSVTLSASGNYVYQVNDNVFIVPTGGLAITQSETRDLTFTDGSAQTTGTLSFEDHLSTIAFLGATAVYQSISADGDAATTGFVTATVYNDFSDPRESLFSIAGSGLAPSLLSTENLGTFGEVSVGVNHVRVLSDGGAGAPRQLNAGVRLDARFSDRIDAYNITAQARLQF